MDSRLRGNDGGGLRRRESMVAVLVLHDNTASFPRRRESIEYDSSSDVGWAKRNVPNTQMLPFPRFVKLLVRIAKLPSPMFPHPVFQVAGHVCVERSLGFVCHDVDRRLFYDRCSVMDSRLRGNDGGDLRRRESIKYDTSFVGWAKRSVPNTQMLPFPRFVKLLVRIAKLPSPMFPHPVFRVDALLPVQAAWLRMMYLAFGLISNQLVGGFSCERPARCQVITS